MQRTLVIVSLNVLLLFGYMGLEAQTSSRDAPFYTLYPPVRQEIKLSGTFGELRSNHFHGGLDIKSARGVSGDSIFAVDDGYVSRISVSAGGYGNALYIQHPSGYTSVYGHLLAFTPRLDSLVRIQQYKDESFEVDIRAIPGVFDVQRGAFIGKMGSTGYSMGPHLHLELRNTHTGVRKNPLLFNFDVEDLTAPHIQRIKLDRLDYRYQCYEDSSLQVFGNARKEDTLTIDAWRMGVGVEAYDPFNNGANKNGLYSVKLEVDSVVIYESILDSLDAQSESYYNAHIDYAASYYTGNKYQKCYQNNSRPLSIYPRLRNHGIISLFKDKLQRVVLSVSDYAGNISQIAFWVRRKEEVTPPAYPLYQFSALPEEAFTLDTAGIRISWREGTLYEPLYATFNIETGNEANTWSDQYSIHCGDASLFESMQITIRPREVPDSLKRKTLMVQKFGNDKSRIVGGNWTDEGVTARSGSFGKFVVETDNQLPTYNLIQHAITATRLRMKFHISDNHTGSGAVNFRGTIDEEWVLGSFDLRTMTVTYDIDLRDLKSGEHVFKFLVTDYVKNENHYVTRFNN